MNAITIAILTTTFANLTIIEENAWTLNITVPANIAKSAEFNNALAKTGFRYAGNMKTYFLYTSGTRYAKVYIQ